MRTTAAIWAVLVMVAPRLVAQSAERSTVVIVTGDQATLPIPTLMEGSAASTANMEVADHLFLHLANLGPELITAGEKSFVPALARSWIRRDSVSLAFDLDPRATWQDGVPVTARDVEFTFERARDPSVAPRTAGVLRNIVSVTAEGEHRVVFRFAHPYAEQFYDAVWHVAPVPAHLLQSIPADRVGTSPFAASPVGDGPYRWVRSVPGQFIELAANQGFFLGRPSIDRLIIRTATDGQARMNLVLSHEADAMDNIPSPPTNITMMAADKSVRLITVPSPTLGFLLFNQRDPSDTSRPHPILTDRDVRRAIILALDRRLLVRASYGEYAEVPYGPTSPILWIRYGAPKPATVDRAKASRLLAGRGWRDTDGDGILDRQGQPLRLSLSVPSSSPARKQIALMAQQQLRQVGIDLVLQQFEFPIWYARHTAGNFDISFAVTTQDPSPSGLAQGWACGGATNYARYCDPAVDSLIARALTHSEGARDTWHAVLGKIEDDAPAAFIYASSFVYAVNRRLGNVTIHPESSWRSVWRWTAGAPANRPDAGQ